MTVDDLKKRHDEALVKSQDWCLQWHDRMYWQGVADGIQYTLKNLEQTAPAVSEASAA